MTLKWSGSGLFRTACLLSACIVSVFTSCTVLEDRSACPCTLYLDLSDPGNGVCDTMMVSVWSAGGFSYTGAVPRELYGEPYPVTVPSRDGVSIFALDMKASSDYIGGQDGGLRIPLGEQCPTAYMYSAFCSTEGETCVDTVAVNKNYCGVTLNFIGSQAASYQICVTGNVNGYSSAGIPVSGEFEYSPEGSGVCYFRIPRQLDESLKLSISVPGGREKVFALGQYISQSGYDWTKTDLEDLAVTIDYASTSLVITIGGWSTTVEYDVVV